MSAVSIAAGASSVVTLAAAGAAWSDCLLLSGAAFALHRLFLRRMEDGAPWDGWRAAVRCITAGVFGLMAAATVITLVAGGLLGLWGVRQGEPQASLALIGAAAVVSLWPRLHAPLCRAEAQVWAALLIVGLISLDRADTLLGLLPCLLAGAVSVGLVWTNWRLARRAASELLPAQRRM